MQLIELLASSEWTVNTFPIHTHTHTHILDIRQGIQIDVNQYPLWSAQRVRFPRGITAGPREQQSFEAPLPHAP